ncbi:MAG: hypothetical protein EOO65_04270 [Methanosarcinales archaeon]|nr:MAG: hypothetical protein EOO65_04270 [Methanosarcinales archaeon]
MQDEDDAVPLRGAQTPTVAATSAAAARAGTDEEASAGSSGAAAATALPDVAAAAAAAAAAAVDDDDDLKDYILTPAEASRRRELWDQLHAPYLKEREKKAREAARLDGGGGSSRARKRSKNNMSASHPAHSAAAAALNVRAACVLTRALALVFLRCKRGIVLIAPELCGLVCIPHVAVGGCKETVHEG